MMRPSSAHRAVSTDTTCISLMPTMMTGRIRSSSGRCRSEKGKSTGKCLYSLADRIWHKKPRRETKGKLSVFRRGIYVICRLVCVVKKCFSRQKSLIKSADDIIRSYWEKVSANLGEDVFTVTNPGFCTTCLFKSLFQVFAFNLFFKSML